MNLNEKSIKILLIEDNPDDAFLAIALLERAGIKFTSKVVMDKEEFLAASRAESFDLILSDNSMGQFSSQDVLSYLKANQIDTPLIVFSGTVSQEQALDIIKQGAVDYIDKDNMKQLVLTIKKVFARERRGNDSK